MGILQIALHVHLRIPISSVRIITPRQNSATLSLSLHSREILLFYAFSEIDGYLSCAMCVSHTFFINHYVRRTTKGLSEIEMEDFEAHFSKGQEIEIGNEDDEGFKGSWYAANIVQTPRKKNKKKVLVEYKTLMDDLETSKPLREYVDTHKVRPQPPQDERFFFEIGEAVEVYHNDGWWEGTITQVLEKNLRYIVYFKGSGEKLEFKQSEMRSYRPWINGRWVRAQELQTIDSSFCIGASVEVCFKDENYRGAWFPATLLKRINYSSFLVEYQSLRLQYMVGKSKETVDSPHIRPLPPDTSQDKRFNLLEQVDAFTDCGWWSGVITKILAGSKYIVFFKHRHEQKEFSHSELRFHMDWIDGKWFQNSKEILPQGQIEAPGQVKSGEAVKTDQNIEMASWCVEDASKNVAIEKSSGQVQSGDVGKTDQNIDMGSRCGEDAAKNVVVEKSPGQARQQAGNQSSPSKLGSPGHRQTHQADPVIDMAVTSGGNAAKTVVAKKSLSFIISRKVDNQSTPDKVSSASCTINSCKKRKIQSTSESDTDCISSSKNKKIQSTSASDTNIIISNKKTKKMQSTTESDTNAIISSKKAKKVQSTPESNADSSQTCKKLKTSEVLKTPLSLIACHARAMATRLQTEADRQYDFATQATEGQGANVEAKNSSEHVEGKRVESPILDEMFLNCSEEGYKDHPKHLNSGQELLKHVLESNGSRNQSSVEGSSHLPPNIIDEEQYEVVDLPKTQVPVRPTKLMIQRPLRRKGEPLARDDIKQQTTKEMSKQTLNVYSRKTIAKDSSTKASVKDVEHSRTIGRLQASVHTSTEAQIKGPEQTTPSKELTNFVVQIQREDATKETDMDGESSDTRDLHQPSSSMCFCNSNVAQIIDENGMSSDNQPAALSVKAITQKDSPIGGSELRNFLNVDVSSLCFEGAAANTLLDQAIGDEVSERTQQSFLICSNADPMLLEDESFPFIKCSPAWEIVESWEVFRVMPQRLHFRPLEQFDMVLREGLAIGSMVSFANIVEKVRNSKLDDPLSILQDRSKALEDLKAHGFNVQPIQARLETLLRIKDEQAKLNADLIKVEDQFNMKLTEKSNRGKELDELNRKIRELQECLNQLSKKKRELTVLEKEVQDPSMAELKKTMDNVRGHIHSVTSEFRTVVATPW